MVFFKARHKHSSYRVSVDGLHPDGDRIEMLFDTGAVYTIVNASVVMDNEIDAKMFEQVLDGKTPKRTFWSASGTEMQGYLSYAEDVKIGKILLDRFYYYLVANTSYSSALLGDNFVSCCQFRHDFDGDILVEDFDKERYTKGLEENIMKADEIYGLLAGIG